VAEYKASLAELRRLADQEGRRTPQAGIVLSVAVGTASGGLAATSAESMHSLYDVPAGRADELAIGGTPEQVAEQIARYVDAGAEKVAVVSAVLPWSDSWPMLAEVRRIILAR
jgi:alkanesulfonate monooxygenase SsuD/methylene tetrahydromethanopterin reductase-like flavin-dependent oxidoreductase (luciferase family)